MILLGLTGSIGMGKTTTAKMFADAGVPGVNADDIVHDLYRGAAAPAVEAAFPGTVHDGVVDRDALSKAVLGNPEALGRLEAIVHPMVRAAETEIIEKHRKAGVPVVLLDIPLLFETGAEARVDKIVVVTCDPDLQRTRVLARPGMTEAKFESILARQVPDAEKRRRADFVIDTTHGMDDARRQVAEILQAIDA